MSSNTPSDQQPTTPDNTNDPAPWTNTEAWLRVLMTLVFGVIFWLSLWALGIAVAINLVMLLATGKANAAVATFARQVAHYQQQVILFATLASDEKPFPFGLPFPHAEQSPAALTPESKLQEEPVPERAPESEPATAQSAETRTTSTTSDDSKAAKKPARPRKKAATRKKRSKKTPGEAKTAQAEADEASAGQAETPANQADSPPSDVEKES